MWFSKLKFILAFLIKRYSWVRRLKSKSFKPRDPKPDPSYVCCGSASVWAHAQRLCSDFLMLWLGRYFVSEPSHTGFFLSSIFLQSSIYSAWLIHSLSELVYLEQNLLFRNAGWPSTQVWKYWPFFQNSQITLTLFE